MAENKAVQSLNERMTKLQDEKRQAGDVYAAATGTYVQKVADIDAEMADISAILDRFFLDGAPGSWQPKKSPAPAKKTAATKK